MNQLSLIRSSVSKDHDMFGLLPEDVLCCIILFLDIPSIGSLVQTSRPHDGTISRIATLEETWLHIVKLRFNLFGSEKRGASCRSKLYGGSNWKDAYRSMSIGNRMPKMRVLFKKKIAFAKGGAYVRSDLEDDLKANDKLNQMKSTGYDDNVVRKHGHQVVSSWVMINHTEDCNLKVASLDSLRTNEHRHLSMSGIGRHTRILRPNRSNDMQRTPYIELQLGFQNIKSGFCTVNVDVSNTTLQMMSTGDQENSGDSSILTQNIIRRGPLKPKIIYRSIGDEVIEPSFSITSCPIRLKPFEFVIVSVNVPLSHYSDRGETIRYETDFLSRAICACTPVSFHADVSKKSKDFFSNENKIITTEEISNCALLNKNQIVLSSLSMATFSSEEAIWEHYMELPGNCIVLTDSSNALHPV